MVQTYVVAKVLLVNPDRKVSVLRRSKTDTRRPLEGDIPGGWVEKGEDFTAAAIRETEEETGIQLPTSDVQLVYAHTAKLDDHNTCWLFFVGHTSETEFKLSSEHDKADWLTLDQAIETISYPVQHDFLVYIKENNLL